MQIGDFVAKWSQSGAAERANKDSYLRDLCDVLGVPHPDPTTGDPARDRYVFEKDAPFQVEGDRVTIRKIDLYKAGCFILEAKQGSEEGALKLGTAKRGTPSWHWEMQKARGQALGYARSFDRPPPFLVVADLGYCFDLFSCFDGSLQYTPFPSAATARIHVKDLASHLSTLKAVFTDPVSLDPSRRSIAVTRNVAEHLAGLKRALDKDQHPPELIAKFLMRCIFTMFAEDIGLLPERIFTDALEKLWLDSPKSFPGGIESLWRAMNDGTSFGFVGKLLKFNGGLFRSPEALPLDVYQLKLLLEAAKCEWSEVEPAIFGTLLERALDPKERHALGAHFTPRAYVERLVRPTIEEPLRADWDVVQVEVRQLVEAAERQKTQKAADQKLKAAGARLKEFHKKLASVQILDPACGTGNFLYVALDILKRLESEVVSRLADLGESALLELEGVRVTPSQFHGIEIKPWAKEIAELVLWIGYLQWQARATGKRMNQTFDEPVLRDYGNIECNDAVLAYEHRDLLRDENGKPVTRWDGETMMKHPATGELVPDERFTLPIYSYTNPSKAAWPDADYIIGNPPYLGARRIRLALGDGYVESLRAAYPEVPETADLVMYWWHKAALCVQSTRCQRFGFITTNSLTQDYSRGVVEQHLSADPGVALTFAIADHPWIEAIDGADVRVAMTVACARAKTEGGGTIGKVTSEGDGPDAVTVETRRVPFINASLRSGSSVRGIAPLLANRGVCFQGVVPAGDGFKLRPADLDRLGIRNDALPTVVRPYVIGRDLVRRLEPKFIVDFFGLSDVEAEQKWPTLFQHIYDHVYPERKTNKRASYRDKWWIFAEPRPAMRKALSGLRRFIVTPYTAKFRPFFFIDEGTLPDAMAYAIASDDAYVLGVLSSRAHVLWATTAGGRLGVGNDPRYTSDATFSPFPFPQPTETQTQAIRTLAERLDEHRRQRQAAHPGLMVTEMYNVLTQVNQGIELAPDERETYEHGLIGILKRLHDELDAAVLDAYAFARNISDQELLDRLTALNAVRADEERKGLVRWVRPDLQHLGAAKPMVQVALMAEPVAAPDLAPSASPSAVPWPKKLAEQIAEVRDLVLRAPEPWTLAQTASAFKGAKSSDVEAVLESLAALGLLVTWSVGAERQWRAARA